MERTQIRIVVSKLWAKNQRKSAKQSSTGGSFHGGSFASNVICNEATSYHCIHSVLYIIFVPFNILNKRVEATHSQVQYKKILEKPKRLRRSVMSLLFLKGSGFYRFTNNYTLPFASCQFLYGALIEIKIRTLFTIKSPFTIFIKILKQF